MKVIELDLPGVLLIKPLVLRDDRGFFLEAFHAERYAAHGLDLPFVQDNHSRSWWGVLRGLHFQRQHPQGKLVRVTRGSVFDVVVDLRPGSPAFGRHTAITLSEEDHAQLWVPPGCAHGFCALSDEADLIYKCTDVYRPEDEGGVRWDDPDLGIRWPHEAPVLSARDAALPRLRDLTPERLPTLPLSGVDA